MERLNLRRQDLESQASQISRSLNDFENKNKIVPPWPEDVGDLPSLERKMLRLRSEVAGIGEVDQVLIKEAQEIESRHNFLSGQLADLEKAAGDLEELIEELEEDTLSKQLGIEIDVSLPRKRIKGLDMLSGGEKSLVSIAALFALISVSPPPFLVLDEVDAALDEKNAKRFADIVRDFSKKTQFVIVTHNRSTMESADALYGVTMEEDGVSKVLSLKLE